LCWRRTILIASCAEREHNQRAGPASLHDALDLPPQRRGGGDARLVRGGRREALRVHGGRLRQGQAPAAFVAGARLVTEPTAIQRAHAALRAKYGWQMRLTDLFSRLAGRIRRRAWIEISA
jgi:hypothetical protein